MSIQSITGSASKVSASPSLIRLSTNNAALTLISVRAVAAGGIPHGTYYVSDKRADLFIAQSDFSKLSTALQTTPFPVTLKYDDAINISLNTNATEFDFATPTVVCELTSVPVVTGTASTGTTSAVTYA